MPPDAKLNSDPSADVADPSADVAALEMLLRLSYDSDARLLTLNVFGADEKLLGL